MERRGVAASAADGRSESGPGAGVAAELDHPAENHVTGDIADRGEGQERNEDDSHVMVAAGYPEKSDQDASMSRSPESSQPPRELGEERSSHKPEPELPSQQIEDRKSVV